MDLRLRPKALGTGLDLDEPMFHHDAQHANHLAMGREVINCFFLNGSPKMGYIDGYTIGST
jgi:hypothetical protein